jgi:hypothetical protein
VLNPLRSERDAFRFLLGVVIVALAVVAVAAGIRAIS